MTTSLLLSRIPTYGFETPNCFAQQYQDNALEDLLLDPENITEPDVKWTDRVVHHRIFVANRRKIMGYIPVVGIYAGAKRLHQCFARSKEVDSKAAVVFRSVLEISGLGLLMVLPDIAITGVRQYMAIYRLSDVPVLPIPPKVHVPCPRAAITQARSMPATELS